MNHPVCCVLDAAVTYARDSFVDSQEGLLSSRGGGQTYWHQAYNCILNLFCSTAKITKKNPVCKYIHYIDKSIGSSLLLKGLTTLVISMITNLNV